MNSSPSPDHEGLVEQLLACSDAAEQQAFLIRVALDFTEEDLQALKLSADRFLRSDLEQARYIGNLLLQLGDLRADNFPRALGQIVHANVHSVGLGEFESAIDLYDRASALYEILGRPGDQARAQVGKVYALCQLGRYGEAEETVAWAQPILEERADWIPLSRLLSNLGILYSNLGKDVESLKKFDQARAYCLKDGSQRDSFLPNIEMNRALVLRYLGRFDESIATVNYARQLLLDNGSTIEATRALQTLGTTYFVLGRYNEALALLDQAEREFRAGGRTLDTLNVGIYISDCLLQIRRFAEALEKCCHLRTHLSAQGVPFELAQVVLNEAMAHIGLQHFARAEELLAEARALFQQLGNLAGVAHTDLQLAALLYLRQHYQQSVELALPCAALFTQHEKPVEAVQAHLIAARSLITLRRFDEANEQLAQASAVGEGSLIPWLEYQRHHLLGAIDATQGDLPAALAEYDAALEALESLRGRLMLEFRAAYLEDKQVVYEDAMLLCLAQSQPSLAFAYTERAKSRALLDLLIGHLELRVEARSPQDQSLVDELMRLREQSDILQRQWEGSDEQRESILATRGGDYAQAQSTATILERRITELWHTLLIRNAAYAEDASLWRTRVEPVQPLLPADTLLVEYFVAREQWYLFLVSNDEVKVHPLAVDPSALNHTLDLLQMNLAAVPAASSTLQLAALENSARKILQRLYDWLLRPVAHQIAPFSRVIVVPHGPLHYLPFHALHTGTAYWLEENEISYLPSASFLHYCTARPHSGRRLAAFGHSVNQTLPHTLDEATTIANLLGGQVFLEEKATKAQVREQIGSSDLLHFATHADFRADNPLFCGLHLADGPLTVLDIFELKVSASLVTLSACQTGRSLIGGGDELLGLMRAWISAGASSLLLSHWPVEDHSTAHLMQRFYAHLATGETKRAALRLAQLELISGAVIAALPRTHPYFWAAFFLVGEPGALRATD